MVKHSYLLRLELVCDPLNIFTSSLFEDFDNMLTQRLGRRTKEYEPHSIGARSSSRHIRDLYPHIRLVQLIIPVYDAEGQIVFARGLPYSFGLVHHSLVRLDSFRHEYVSFDLSGRPTTLDGGFGSGQLESCCMNTLFLFCLCWV
jgi:hypothetical protein